MKEARRLDELIVELRGDLLRHPFLGRFSTMGTDSLRVFAEQFYCFVQMFPRYLGALLWVVPDEHLRAIIISNLVDECGGIEAVDRADSSVAHPTLFRRFCGALNIHEHELAKVVALESTTEFLRDYERLILHSSFLTAMGAMGPGNESLSTKWVPVLNGLRARSEFSERDLEFFIVHQPADDVHGSAMCAALLPHLNTSQDWEEMVCGARAAVNARLCFFDGLQQVLP